MADSIKFSDASLGDGLKDQGNLIVAIVAGVLAAIFSACLWVEFTSLTGKNIGYLAAAVAGLVGLAVRFAGGGTTLIFGLVGAIFTLAGTLAGQSGSEIMLATDNKFDFYGVMTHIDLVQTVTTLLHKGTVLTYVIYAVAILGAFRISIHKKRKLP